MMKASKNLFGRLLLAAAVGTVALAGCAPEDDTSTNTGLLRKCAQEEKTMAELDAIEYRTFGTNATDGEDDASAKSYDVKRDIEFPVHFLIVNEGGAVSDAQIAEQLRVLNEGYDGTSGGFDTRIRFTLGSVERISKPAWNNVQPGTAGERDAKKYLFDKYPGSHQLRVVLTGLGGGLLGWATFPSDYEAKPQMDGLMVLSGSVPGGDAAPYNEGDTLTHEVGHWVGLYHTFQGGCFAPGDGVKDTPRVASPNFGAPTVGEVDSCTSCSDGKCLPGNVDLVDNFMDYTDDVAMFKFTHHQAWRAGWMTFKYRTDAITSTDE